MALLFERDGAGPGGLLDHRQPLCLEPLAANNVQRGMMRHGYSYFKRPPGKEQRPGQGGLDLDSRRLGIAMIEPAVLARPEGVFGSLRSERNVDPGAPVSGKSSSTATTHYPH